MHRRASLGRAEQVGLAAFGRRRRDLVGLIL